MNKLTNIEINDSINECALIISVEANRIKQSTAIDDILKATTRIINNSNKIIFLNTQYERTSDTVQANKAT